MIDSSEPRSFQQSDVEQVQRKEEEEVKETLS